MKDQEIPSQNEIMLLPRWARVSFAARCAERVFPIYDLWVEESPIERRGHGRALKSAIDIAYKAAEFASADSAASSAASDAAAAAGAVFSSSTSHPNAATNAMADAAADAANAAASANIAAVAPAASSGSTASLAVAQAYEAAAAISSEADITRKLTGKAICQDFDFLRAKAANDQWTNSSKVPHSIWGELWQKEKPEWSKSKKEIAKAKLREAELKEEELITLKRTIAHMESTISGARQAYDNATSSYNSKVDEYEDALSNFALEKEAGINSMKEDWESQKETIKNDLENAKKSVDERLLIEAPKEYWEERASSHKKQALIWGIASLLVTSGTIPLMWWGAYRYFDLIGGVDKVKVGTAFLPIIGGAMVFLIIRIIIKMFLSNMHLMVDAQLRVAMVQTYTALIAKDGAKEKEDRHIALSALFRPPGDGIVKEPVSGSPLELVTKTIAK